MGVVPGCECGLCKAAAGPLLIVDEVASFDEVLASEMANVSKVLAGQVMASSFAEPPQVPNNEAFADNDEANPPKCPGCNGTMNPWNNGPLTLKWDCPNGCYYCVHSEGCGFQDQSTFCDSCYGCKQHCTCDKDYCCGSCDAEVAYNKWCESDDLCQDCCSCDAPSSGDGSEKYGVSKKPGWVERGITVEIPPKSRDYEEAWGFKPQDYDLVSEMASFYVKEFVVSNVQLLGVDRALIPDSLLFIVDEAKDALDAQIERIEPVLQSYIDMAVGGELRYHQAMRAVGLGKGSFSRESAWVNWRHVREQVGPDALLDAAKLAREVQGGGILGVAWAVPAEVLHARITDQIDSKTFVDRAFSLQHNGGCLFNKVIWKTANRPGWDLNAIQWVIGPSHAANPIQWGPLLAAADNEAVSLFNRYWKAANKVRARIGLKVEVMPSWRDGLVVIPGAYGPRAGYNSTAMSAKGMGEFYAWNANENLLDATFDLGLTPEMKAEIDALMPTPENLPAAYSWGCANKDCTCAQVIAQKDKVYRDWAEARNRFASPKKMKGTRLRDVISNNAAPEYIQKRYNENQNVLLAVIEKTSCPNKTKKVVETKGKFEIPAKPHPDATWSPGGYGGGGKWIMPIATNTSDEGVMWDEKVPPTVKYANTYVNATASTSTLTQEQFEQAYKKVLNNPWQ